MLADRFRLNPEECCFQLLSEPQARLDAWGDEANSHAIQHSAERNHDVKPRKTRITRKNRRVLDNTDKADAAGGGTKARRRVNSVSSVSSVV